MDVSSEHSGRVTAALDLPAAALLTSAAQLTAAFPSPRLDTFEVFLATGDLVPAARELYGVGLEQGLGSGFWEPLAVACRTLGLSPGSEPWTGDVYALAESAP